MRTLLVVGVAAIAALLLFGVAAPRGSASAQTAGAVTLCEHPFFRGTCEDLTGDDPDLSDNAIGNDTVSSLRANGTTVALYEDVNYGGACQLFSGDIALLFGTTIGNDTVSSIRVGATSCEAPAPTPTPTPSGGSIQLCEHTYYAGLCETITADDPDLSDNAIGNDTVSSVLTGGQSVAVYEDVNYGGACEVISADTPYLWNMPVGNDSISSVRLGATSCDSSTPAVAGPSVVVLCPQADFGGTCEALSGDDADLSDNIIGNDLVASVLLVPSDGSAAVTLYADPYYGGACQSFNVNTPTLVGTAVGAFTASSIRFGWTC